MSCPAGRMSCITDPREKIRKLETEIYNTQLVDIESRLREVERKNTDLEFQLGESNRSSISAHDSLLHSNATASAATLAGTCNDLRMQRDSALVVVRELRELLFEQQALGISLRANVEQLAAERTSARGRTALFAAHNKDLLDRLNIAERDKQGLMLDVAALASKRDSLIMAMEAMEGSVSIADCKDTRLDAANKDCIDQFRQFGIDVKRFGFERVVCLSLSYKNEDLEYSVASLETEKAQLLERCAALESQVLEAAEDFRMCTADTAGICNLDGVVKTLEETLVNIESRAAKCEGDRQAAMIRAKAACALAEEARSIAKERVWVYPCFSPTSPAYALADTSVENMAKYQRVPCAGSPAAACSSSSLPSGFKSSSLAVPKRLRSDSEMSSDSTDRACGSSSSSSSIAEDDVRKRAKQAGLCEFTDDVPKHAKQSRATVVIRGDYILNEYLDPKHYDYNRHLRV